jgi:hypothetical protein
MIMAGSISFGQEISPAYDFDFKNERVNTKEVVPFRPTANTNSGDRALNILWTEDFSGGTGLTTGNGTWATSGADGGYWSIAAATTSPNGFPLSMTADHLYWNSYDGVGNEGAGNFATTPVDGSIESPAIDLTGYTDVAMEFTLNAMFCCNDEPWTYAISSDNGATYSAEQPLDLGLTANDNSNDLAEPVKHSAIITSLLDANGANNNDVKIRFTWKGVDANGAGQMSTHYYWTVDDIVIYELPAYEIAQKQLWLADINNAYEYTDFPANQVTTLTVQSEVVNNGVNEPTNFDMEVTVFDASQTIVDGPVSGGTLYAAPLSSGETDTLTFATAISINGYGLGEYKVRCVTSYDETDEILENDTLWRTFYVTENTLGHINYDFNPIEGLVNYSETSRTGGRFDVASNTDVHGIDVYLLSAGGTVDVTSVDVPFTIYIDNLTDDLFVGAYEYQLETAMLDDWYTFNFHDATSGSAPVTLEPGKVYAVTMETFSGSVLWYSASLVDADFSGAFYYNGDSQWYWSGDEPWLLLNMDESLSTDVNADNSYAIGQNVPNPFNENSMITYSIKEGANVSVEFVDVSGKVVKTINQGNQTAGSYQIDLNAGDFAEGVYFYTFTIGAKKVTKRMVVTK